MPVEKVDSILSNNITLTAGSGNQNSATATTQLGWHKIILISLTNGSTPPATTPASAVVQVSGDNTNWYNFQSALQGSLVASAVASYTVLVWSAAQYVRVMWTAAPDQNVTGRAEISEALEIANSVTASGSPETLVATADSSPSPGAQRTNLYNEVASSFAYNQTTIGTSAVQLASNVCMKGCLVKALSTNTGLIYVGDASVSTSNGFELVAGSGIEIPVNNSDLIYCVASATSQKICFVAV